MTSEGLNPGPERLKDLHAELTEGREEEIAAARAYRADMNNMRAVADDPVLTLCQNVALR